jgi:hypothetical protein
LNRTRKCNDSGQFAVSAVRREEGSSALSRSDESDTQLGRENLAGTLVSSRQSWPVSDVPRRTF